MTDSQSIVKFMSIGSGSSGNCYCFAMNEGLLLLDAGLPIRTIKHALEKEGYGLDDIKAILVTHEHSDHTRSLFRLANASKIPIYGKKLLFSALDRLRQKPIPVSQRVYIESELPFELMGASIIPFDIPHDSLSNVGYLLRFPHTSIGIISDTGYVTPLIRQYAAMADYLVLEANYDPGMLIYGKYPPELKARIASKNGHLSNEDAAIFLASLDPKKLKHVWLCHLSRENNTHEKCRETFSTFCDEIFQGRDYLSILPRFDATDLIPLL